MMSASNERWSQRESPWSVAVPVTRGRFTSVLEEHATCNVVVEPAAIDRFGARPIDDAEAADLLYTDLQTSLFSHVVGRLGSGRAGAFKGWYLKGVGRTPLAANWHRPDLLHNTGHMTASAAIREWVITAYMQAVGLEQTIVPCVGVLLAPLEPSLRGLASRLYAGKAAESLPPVDRYLQAITVKPADFVRPSNLIWLLHHLTPAYVGDGRSSFATFAECLGACLGPQGDAVESLRPDQLAELLEAATQRGFWHYRDWFQVGVWWGSFSNNTTLDGRFLDLETPAVAGGPLLGVLAGEGKLKSGTIGLEALYHLAQMRWFCAETCRVLGDLPRAFPEVERAFAAELAGEIEARLLRPPSLLVDRERACEAMHELLAGDLDHSLGEASRQHLDRLLEDEYASCFGESRRPPSPPELRPLPEIPPIVTEPGLRWRYHAQVLAGGEVIAPTSSGRCRARALAELVESLDATTDIERLRGKLERVPADLATLVETTSASVEDSPALAGGVS